jgi:hypothetical protein
VRADSAALVQSLGTDARVRASLGPEYGLPFVTVGEAQPFVPVSFAAFADEADPGPYPLPATTPIEGGDAAEGDRHAIVVDTATCHLYELYDAFRPTASTGWVADAGAVFDLRSNALRPEGFVSADAAGLAVFPGLLRYDELVERGAIPHALRVTIAQTQRGHVHPATHGIGTATTALPAMGMRLRLKASFDCSQRSPEGQVLCTALKKYGLLVADRGVSLMLSGDADPRWSEHALPTDLLQFPGSAFEVVDTGPVLP